jgi:flagellar basal body rod protein FlgG
VSDAFSILKVATSGLGVFNTCLNAVAENIANINNVAKTEDPAFLELLISVASRVGADGVGDGAARRRDGGAAALGRAAAGRDAEALGRRPGDGAQLIRRA